ncbi:hypothetical protein C8R44DRAFT_878540 [Mycena epipterygia]|nr:hypothetical protein C8R44DRAFT_878540 [Mycena epipterygia]
MATSASALPNVQLLFGPMLIGVFFNMILYGVLLGQVLTYYQIYRSDAGWMRYFVLVLFLIETANTGFDIAFLYQPLILEYGQKPIFFPTFFINEPLCVVLVSTPIQLFFAWRIRSLTKSYWVPAIVGILALASFTGGIWTAGTSIIVPFQQRLELIVVHNSALLWFLASCVADILITISLVISLAKRKTNFSTTDSVIDKIIRMTVQTGMLTAVFSILDVICFMVLPHAAVNFVWDLALSKLYTNCLMSTLNARQRLNKASATSGSVQQRNNSHGPMMSPNLPTGRRHPDHSRHISSSAVYELDTQKPTYDVEAAYGVPPRDEYGIQVTKVCAALRVRSACFDLLTATKVIERVEDLIPQPYTQ